jgi:hypothetical protein
MHHLARWAGPQFARALVIAGSTLALMSFASAQPTFKNIRGTVEKIDGFTMVVKTREGDDVTVKLGEKYTVRGVVKIPLSDVKPGSRVGVASVPQAAGGPAKALEVHVFPDDIKPPEMQTPHDLAPQSTMTNATVTETVAANDGQTLTLKFKDGETKILVPPGTPIATYVPGTRDELKPGAKIMIFRATKEPDGMFAANGVSVGRDGFAPPM